MPINIIGWDIGGAHLKAVVLDGWGEVNAVYQKPCPLWKGLVELQNAVQAVLQDLPDEDYQHAITMTGELVDLFDTRDQGVRQIINGLSQYLPAGYHDFYAGSAGLIPADQITAHHLPLIASANWLASADYAARALKTGLFIDIGSTTTDILALNQGQVQATGYSDFQRLQSGELVYTGIVRTPVMAVVQSMDIAGKTTGVMAEYFATMADIYRITGELDEAHDQTDTADGKEKSVHASARRLARMVGCDFYPEELDLWIHVANAVKMQQVSKISQHCLALIKENNLPDDCVWIGAGVGRFLAQQIASQSGYPYVDFSALYPQPVHIGADINIADCAPAFAVAKLAAIKHPAAMP